MGCILIVIGLLLLSSHEGGIRLLGVVLILIGLLGDHKS